MSAPQWSGQFIQTLSISGEFLSIVPGNTVVIPGGNPEDWSLYNAISPVNFNNNFLQNVGEISATNNLTITTNSNLALQSGSNMVLIPQSNLYINFGSSNGRIITNTSSIIGVNTNALLNSINLSTINGNGANFNTINASTLNVNTVYATSTINVISTLSSSVLEAAAITNLSSINGQSLSTFLPVDAEDWSYFEAKSTIQGGSNNFITTGYVQAGSFAITTPSTSYMVNSQNDAIVQVGGQIQDVSGVSEFLMGVKSQKLGSPSFYLQHQGGTSSFGVIGAINMFNDSNGNGTIEIEDDFGTNTIFTQGVLSTTNISASTINTTNLNTSTINSVASLTSSLQANTISSSALSVSSINGQEFTTGGIVVSTLATTALSTIGASIKEAFMSSIVFNPQFNPNLDVNLGLGNWLGSVVGGLAGNTFGVVAGTVGMATGIAGLTMPRVQNNINSNIYEQLNMPTQLQISTLGQQISSILRVVDLSGNEKFISTLSDVPPITAIRSLGDPLNLISTPSSFVQAFGQWVELPPTGLTSNVSTLNLSTLSLAPSTILKSSSLPGGVLQVLENNGSNYGQVLAQAYSMNDGTSSNGTLFYQSSNDRPGFLDSAFSSHTLAYTTDIPGFNPNPTFSNIQVSSINNQPVNFRASQEFYVAENGNDSWNGSASAPFLTIQAAINAAEAISSSLNIINIFVSAGTYTQNITFNKGYVALIGSLNSQDVNTSTNLIGNITINVANSDDLIGRQVVIQGFQITGAISDTSAFQHTLNIQDCKVVSTSVSCLVINPTSALQRTFLTNCEFVQSGTTTASVIICNVGFIELINVDIFNGTNNSVCLSIGGSARVGRCYNCNLESGTTATTTASAIVSINSSSTGIHSFGFTNIYYTSASNKTGSPTATGINCAGATTLAVIGCVFTLTGTSDLANNYIIKRTGVGVVTLASANLQAAPAALGSCTRIDPSIILTDYITPRITAGTISTSQLQVSTINNQPVQTYNPNPSFSSINVLSNISTGSLNINTGVGFFFPMITSDRGNFLELSLQAANPDPGFITYIKGMDTGLASNQYPAYLAIYPARSTIGVGCTPESSYKFDIGGAVRARSGVSFISSLTASDTYTTQLQVPGNANITSLSTNQLFASNGFISTISTNSLTAISSITTNFLNVLNPLPFGDPNVNYQAYLTLSNGVIRMTTPTPTSNVAMRELLFGDGYLYYQGGNGDFSSGAGDFEGFQWTSMNAQDSYMSYTVNGTSLNVNNRINTESVYANNLVSTSQIVANTATIGTINSNVSVAQVGTGSCVASGINYDGFTGFNTFNGKQQVSGGYFGTTDSSLPAGNGQFTFWFQPVLSSLQTITTTYFANSTTQPTGVSWVGNATADGNGNLSTIQVYGDQGRDIFVSYIGWI